MNFLAHLYFADATPESRVANLMGDYLKGRIAADWQPNLRDGVILHRRIDGYTDSHPLVLQSAARLSARRRRFAGIILDICYDHYLCRHWDRFSDQPLDRFIEDCYRQLSDYQGYLPESMQRPLRLLIEQDWLSTYADPDTICLVLDRVASRLSQPQRMLGAGEEFIRNYSLFERDFLSFYPQLCQFVLLNKS
ncbi:MAG: ACP phosphodiesterase [Motiliproteus sp.]